VKYIIGDIYAYNSMSSLNTFYQIKFLSLAIPEFCFCCFILVFANDIPLFLCIYVQYFAMWQN